MWLPCKFVGGVLDGQWRKRRGATFELFQTGTDEISRYKRAATVWHDEENECLSHCVYELESVREGRIRGSEASFQTNLGPSYVLA